MQDFIALDLGHNGLVIMIIIPILSLSQPLSRWVVESVKLRVYAVNKEDQLQSAVSHKDIVKLCQAAFFFSFCELHGFILT